MGSDQHEYEGSENDVYASREQAEWLEETEQSASDQDPEREEQSEIDVVLHSQISPPQKSV